MEMASCLTGMSIIAALFCATISATTNGLADKGLKENTLFIRNHKLDLPSLLRNKRASSVVSLAVRAGTRAVQKVLRGSKPLTDQTLFMRYAKLGGLARAKADFEALRPINVHEHTAQVRFGQVGDRNVFLSDRGNHGMPVMLIGKQYNPKDVDTAAAPHWQHITYFE